MELWEEKCTECDKQTIYRRKNCVECEKKQKGCPHVVCTKCGYTYDQQQARKEGRQNARIYSRF